MGSGVEPDSTSVTPPCAALRCKVVIPSISNTCWSRDKKHEKAWSGGVIKEEEKE